VASWLTCQRLAVAGHTERLGMAADQPSELLNRVGMYLRGRGQFPDAKARLERV
jgi:hypothetical protein